MGSEPLPEAYTTISEQTAVLRGAPVIAFAKPGLAGGREHDATVALAAALVSPAPHERVLLLGCGNGALGVALARQLSAGRVTLHDPSLLALRMARLTLDANAVTNANVSEALSLLPAEAERFDRVLILTPQSRALGRRWLVEAFELLRPGGRLNLAGATNGGVQSLAADAADLFGGVGVLGYAKGCRVVEAVKRGSSLPQPGWADEPGIAPESWLKVALPLPDGFVELLSLPGVFSASALDAGTALLLQHASFSPGQRVLDLGCGFGPLGVAAACAGATATMLDVNLLAVAAAQANVERLELHQAEVLASDALEAVAGRSFDLILTNPPFHAGKAVDTRMAAAFLAQARVALAPGGHLLLVANRFLPYERILMPHFAHVEVAAQTAAYRVLAAYA
jgi:16S rRNA (guanine1207-N2)-methyltransferase